MSLRTFPVMGSLTGCVLGEPTDWNDCPVRLYAVQGFWGGCNIHLKGSGWLAAQVVDRSGGARTGSVQIPPAEAREQLRTLLQSDPLGQARGGHTPVPDEGCQILEVVGAEGCRGCAMEWANQTQGVFHSFCQGLRSLLSRVEVFTEGAYLGPQEIGLEATPPQPAAGLEFSVPRHRIDFTAAHARAAQMNLDMLPRLLERLRGKPALLASILDRSYCCWPMEPIAA